MLPARDSVHLYSRDTDHHVLRQPEENLVLQFFLHSIGYFISIINHIYTHRGHLMFSLGFSSSRASGGGKRARLIRLRKAPSNINY